MVRLLAIFMVIWTAPAAAHVFGADDRRPVFIAEDNVEPGKIALTRPQKTALRAVGVFTCRRGVKGSAFLIDPESIGLPAPPSGKRVLMSVAHGFFRSGDGASRGDCHFRPTGSGRYGKLKITDVVPGARQLSDETYDQDYAFGLVMAGRVEGLKIEPTESGRFHRHYSHYKAGLAVASYDSGRRSVVIAGDCAGGQYSHMGPHLVGHHCDFEKSASGAPLLDVSDGGVRVVGLNFGQTRAPVDPDGNVMPVVDRNRHWNLAILFDDRMVEALRDYLNLIRNEPQN